METKTLDTSNMEWNPKKDEIINCNICYNSCENKLTTDCKHSYC